MITDVFPASPHLRSSAQSAAKGFAFPPVRAYPLKVLHFQNWQNFRNPP
jgi:hypothetical protein